MKDWVKQNCRQLPYCYIAIMPRACEGQSPLHAADGYDLEIEEDEGSIRAVWTTNCPATDAGLAQARQEADKLQKLLEAQGTKVFSTREEWEDFTSLA